MTTINTNTPSTTIRNNKRRRPISTTTKLIIGVAATTLFNNQLIILTEAKHPSSIHKNTKHNKHTKIRGTTNSNNKPPINVSADNPLGSTSTNNNINNEINGNDTLLLGKSNVNNNGGGRVIIVQPNYFGSSAHVASEWGEQISSSQGSTNNNNSIGSNNNNNSIQQNKQLQSSSGGAYHSWPHPDTFNDESAIKAQYDPLDPSLHPGTDLNPNNQQLPQKGMGFSGSSNLVSGGQGGEELVVNESNKMGKGQMGGHSTKYHGWVLGSTGSNNQNGGNLNGRVVVQPNNLGAAEDQPGDGDSGVHYYQPNGYGGADSASSQAAQEVVANQSPQGSSSTSGNSEKYDTIIETAVVGSAEVAAELLGSAPLLDEDLGHSVQVILRPRLTNEDNTGEVVNSQPLGSSSSNAASGGNESEVYYYDPAALQSSAASSSSNGKNAGEEESSTPELTLPETVYDISGQALKLEDVHNGGKNEVFLEVQPRAVWGSSANSLDSGSVSSSSRGGGMSERLSSLQAKLQFNSSGGSSSSSSSGGGTQSQDQLIVLFTIATMAVMVGMLSAQRLRSKKLLESCMGLDDDEEEEEEWTPNPIFGGQGQQQQQVRYDKKFDTESTGLSPRNNGSSGTSPRSNSSDGFSALLGRRNSIGQGSSYGTNDGGGLHFRGIGGDLEKFDV